MRIRFLTAILLLAVFTACSSSQPIPTVIPTATPTPIPPTTSSSITSDKPSGPYAVILIEPEYKLNIHSGPGPGNDIVGSVSSEDSILMRTGLSSVENGILWVEVNTPSGGRGWVNSKYLTEYITPDVFCADARVLTLLQDLQEAIHSSGGELLAPLVSPTHGMDVWLWEKSHPVNIDAAQARRIFESTDTYHWGYSPMGGEPETVGTFKDAVLPELTDTFVDSTEKRCNDRNILSFGEPWPSTYANVNFYQVFRPSKQGEGGLDWNAWLVGVEFVSGQPYLFAMIHFIWTP